VIGDLGAHPLPSLGLRRSTVKSVPERVDWSKRADYIRDRHGVDTGWADEAVADPGAAWLDPDPASASGLSVRVIGYSPAAGAVLTVILLPARTDPDDPPDGDWWGANAWPSNPRDHAVYNSHPTDPEDSEP